LRCQQSFWTKPQPALPADSLRAEEEPDRDRPSRICSQSKSKPYNDALTGLTGVLTRKSPKDRVSAPDRPSLRRRFCRSHSPSLRLLQSSQRYHGKAQCHIDPECRVYRVSRACGVTYSMQRSAHPIKRASMPSVAAIALLVSPVQLSLTRHCPRLLESRS
jgi:hypothetical protein